MSRKPDYLFEAMCEALAVDQDQLTTSARGKINKALCEIRPLPGTSPERLKRAVREYRRTHPTWECSALAIAAHWPDLVRRVTVVEWREQKKAEAARLAEKVRARDVRELEKSRRERRKREQRIAAISDGKLAALREIVLSELKSVFMYEIYAREPARGNELLIFEVCKLLDEGKQ